MPKAQTERIIDVPYASRSGGGMVLSGGGGSSVDLSAYLRRDGTLSLTGDLDVATGVTIDGVDLSAHQTDPNAHHNAATAGDGIQLTGQQVAVDTTVVRTSRQVISGGGLTGGGDLSADRTLAVGAGTLITVGADSVGVTPGANYQFVGTGAGTAAGWRDVSELAGDGLTAASGVLAVGVANSGAAGLTVEANAVRLTSSSNPGANARVLATAASGGLQLVTLASSATFASGFAGAGYRIDYGITEAGKASAEFDNLTVRGRMRVYELLIQQIRATNGSVFVASASRAEQVTSVGDLWTVNDTQLTFNGNDAEFAGLFYRIQTRAAVDDDSRDLYHGFLTGDIVRSQRFALNSSGTFTPSRQSNLRVGTSHSLWEYTAHWRGGDVPVVGDDFVRLGSDREVTRQGALYLTADDSNAPYIDIVDGIEKHADWNTADKIKVRLGKLTGITDSDFGGTLSGYGLYANNVYLRGQIVVTGGNALTTGGAAADINANTTTIDGGKITANTITADRLSVTSLSAITATLGTVVLGTGGGIYQGTGTFGSPETGLKIWNDSGIGRIGGYKYSGSVGVLQWYADTDGILKAGGGAVALSENGIRVARAAASADEKNAYGFVDDTDAWRGGMMGYISNRVTSTTNELYLAAQDSTKPNAVRVLAYNATTHRGLWAGFGCLSVVSGTGTYADTIYEVPATTPTPSTIKHRATEHYWYKEDTSTLLATLKAAALDLNTSTLRLRLSRTPGSSAAPGNAGDFCWDASYFYICTAADTWRRVAHSTW